MRKKFMIKMASIGAVVLLAAGMAACGKKTEAVITTDGEEFSEPEKEYPTVAQSRAKKFSYNDLTAYSCEYTDDGYGCGRRKAFKRSGRKPCGNGKRVKSCGNQGNSR